MQSHLRFDPIPGEAVRCDAPVKYKNPLEKSTIPRKKNQPSKNSQTTARVYRTKIWKFLQKKQKET